MNLRELTFPIRIYWDPAPSSHDSAVDNLRICDEITDLKILSLNLACESAEPGTPCLDILTRLRDKNIAITLTVPSNLIDAATIATVSRLNVRTLLGDVPSLDELMAFSKKIKQARERPVTIGASVNLNRDNYKDIPEIISLCDESIMDYLVFPMQRIVSEKECFYLTRAEREALSLRLKTMPAQNVKLVIHDPFLWKVFNPDIKYSEGGCQGANSMLYISPDNNVYPCPLLPVDLGNLIGTSLKDIILSPKKKELRKTLNVMPDECLDCDEKEDCSGGCRGRAYVISHSFNKSDPACR